MSQPFESFSTLNRRNIQVADLFQTTLRIIKLRNFDRKFLHINYEEKWYRRLVNFCT